MLRHIEGKLWIDSGRCDGPRRKRDVTETISIRRLILARIGPGTHIELDRMPLVDIFGYPSRIV